MGDLETTYTLSRLAELLGGQLVGDGSVVIRGVAGIKDAGPGDVTFLHHPSYADFVPTTEASAIIGPIDMDCKIPSIRFRDPYIAVAKLLAVFAGDQLERYRGGLHPSALIDSAAEVGDNVSIGPYCTVGPGVVIGDNTVIVSHTFVGEGSRLGSDCLVYPNVTIRERSEIGDRVILHPGVVIGADGFGYAREGDDYIKIPQLGRVIIEDDVEIGANSTIDRATIGATRIERGCKLDNQTMIAHNVVVGRGTVMAAQSGVSGSTVIGHHVVIAGQVGLVGHINIGDRAVIASKSGVSKDVAPGRIMFGYPARERSLSRRLLAHQSRLPDMSKKLKELEKRIECLEGKGDDGTTTEDD